MLYVLIPFKRDFNLDEDYHIYYRRKTKWIALGTFEQAKLDDNECEWEFSKENTPELHLLIVSLMSTFIICNLI